MNGISELLTLAELPALPPFMGDDIKPKGQFQVDIVRKNGDIEAVPFPNGLTTLGFNLLLDSIFRNYSGGATLYPFWFIGLISHASFTGLSVADIASSHSGWIEDSTHYTPPTFTGAVNNGGGYTSGATTMTINGVSQALPAGTSFTVAGDTLTHTILSSVGGATPTSITFTPALNGSVSNSAVITFLNGRPQWIPTAASAKSITNSASVNFAINLDSTVIDGIFVISDPTLGGTSGLLYSAGTFASSQTLFNGDTLKITYTVSLS